MSTHEWVLEYSEFGRLKALYPHDQATGYAENDFRGIFWAEVAPPVAPAK